MTNTTTKLREEAVAALARLQTERAQVRKQHRAEIADFDAEAKKLRAAIRALSGARPRPKRQRTAAVQAGPKALNEIRSVLAAGPLSQAQIVADTGLNDGTVSYALRALVESGEITATGQRISGSREFRSTGRERSVA